MKPIYTLDIETDPFVHKRDPFPFVVGLYTGDRWEYTWGNDCIERMHEIVLSLPPGIIFAHNGGKFDYFYMMDWVAKQKRMMIINNRIVRAYLWRNDDLFHEIRDSYAIMPFPLKKFEKETIDYRCFERELREKNKAQIVKYLKKDCTALHQLCVQFIDTFGDNLTIGGTSMKQLRKMHDFDTLDEVQDEMIRSKYYYGGRVQCFEKGIITPTKGNQIIAYDLNQCYPYSMREFKHPISEPTGVVGNEITPDTYFVKVEGRNYGAFPIRDPNANFGLRFDVERGIFTVSIHEFKAGVETGLFEVEDVLETVDFNRAGSFDTFVDHFHGLRRDAQLNGDKIGTLFYKFVCNSCYGKFAQSPDNYYNYMITDMHMDLNPDNDKNGFHPCTIIGSAGYVLWKQPSMNSSRYNVATGASITGAARSLLIRAIANAKRPLYCDTDSIICEGLDNVPIDETKLGAWKIETRAVRMAIGGRKLYAIFNDRCPKCSGTRCRPVGVCKEHPADKDAMFHTYGCVKLASKGVHLTPTEIEQVANGYGVTWRKDAPTFNFKTHTASYISRDVKMTG